MRFSHGISLAPAEKTPSTISREGASLYALRARLALAAGRLFITPPVKQRRGDRGEGQAQPDHDPHGVPPLGGPGAHAPSPASRDPQVGPDIHAEAVGDYIHEGGEIQPLAGLE